jgi:anti-anti-sigma regulatory factor
MGLQNATITRISSGVVRTTHVTGVLTDLGLEIAHALSILLRGSRHGHATSHATGHVTGVSFAREVWRSPGAHPTAWRILLLATILASFALGAGLGAAAFDFVPRLAMFPPVLFLLWIVYQDVLRPIAELEPSTLVGESGYDLPPSMALFHLRHGRQNAARVHRLPNLVAWSEGLASEVRVVVLDLTDVTALNADSAVELRALLERLRSQHRSLVLAGLTHAQYLQLKQSGAGELLHAGRVHADLDLALAAGFNLLPEAHHHERA